MIFQLLLFLKFIHLELNVGNVEMTLQNEFMGKVLMQKHSGLSSHLLRHRAFALRDVIHLVSGSQTAYRNVGHGRKTSKKEIKYNRCPK